MRVFRRSLGFGGAFGLLLATSNAVAANAPATSSVATTKPSATKPSTTRAPTSAAPAARTPADSALADVFGEKPAFDQPWTGDLAGMRERGYIRVLVPYNRTFFFYDGLQPRGFAYEFMTEFGKQLAKKEKDALKTQIVFVPVQRDQFVPRIVAGRGDIAVAGLTLTADRAREVAFVPYEKRVQEIVVTDATAPALSSVEDLSGRRVFVRRSSSYFHSLQSLNERLRATGRKPVQIVEADENLETEDILELVNAGVVQYTLCDRYIARTWAGVLPNVRIHENLVTRADAEVGPIVRKQSPELQTALADFIATHGPGTTFGNVLFKRYTAENTWIRNPNATDERQRLDMALPFFEKYAKEYGFDHLLIAAQAYQESRIDQTLRSNAGAVGVMQIKPDTAADASVGIPDVRSLDNNVHAGVKYLRHISDRYFSDAHFDDLNRHMFAFAAYNAGPARVQKLRAEAGREGLDPNQWFNNVEIVAARDVGREPVEYARNILKYWVAYRLAQDQEPESPPDRKQAALVR
jgi:membrane-bound lytic murein transglycosylase MltF